jgi:hypothetical protein
MNAAFQESRDADHNIDALVYELYWLNEEEAIWQKTFYICYLF